MGKIVQTNATMKDGTKVIVDIYCSEDSSSDELAIIGVCLESNTYKLLFEGTREIILDCLEIPDNCDGVPITSIKSRAFKSKYYGSIGKNGVPLKNLILPDSITSIESGAFLATYIYYIRWPSFCETIQCNTFTNSKLKHLYNTLNVKKIEKSAFKGCIDLISIESSTMLKCTSIKNEAFALSGISEFFWPVNCKNVPESCFSGCKKLRLVYNMDKIVNNGAFAFCGTAIETFSIGKKCKKVGFECFRDCTNLKTVIWNDICEFIPNFCFYRCYSLSVISNISAVTQIGRRAFFQCSSLKDFDWPDGCSTISTGCFEKSALENIKLPSNLREIESDAFSETNLKMIDLSNLSQTTIKIGEHSFPNNTIVKYPYYM